MPPTQLPYWLQIIQALGPSLVAVIVGLVAAYIAYRQFKNASDKLRLDLFEKRYVIYQELRAVLATTMREGAVSYEEVLTFRRNVRGAEFLFGIEVEKFIERVGEKLNKLAYHKGLIRAFHQGEIQDEAQYQGHVDSEYNLMLEVDRLLREEARAIFEPYLSFSHLK